jgi:hypothetical protein
MPVSWFYIVLKAKIKRQFLFGSFVAVVDIIFTRSQWPIDFLLRMPIEIWKQCVLGNPNGGRNISGSKWTSVSSLVEEDGWMDSRW